MTQKWIPKTLHTPPPLVPLLRINASHDARGAPGIIFLSFVHHFSITLGRKLQTNREIRAFQIYNFYIHTAVRIK